MDVHDAILERRSIKHFLHKEVDPEYIIDILDAGRHAPSAGNQQAWKFILVKQPMNKDKIADACYQQQWMSEAAVQIVVCSMEEEIKRNYGVRGEVLYAIQNCAMAMQNMLLKAFELDLGACMISAFDESMMNRALNIPANIRVQGIVCVGYAGEQPPRKLLKSLENLTYFEEYRGRLEDFDDSFYQWSGIMKKQADRLLGRMKQGVSGLRDRINEKFKEKRKVKEGKQTLDATHLEGNDHENIYRREN